ncbi:MAG: trigger factor, partial [Phycicoccus sp.]
LAGGDREGEAADCTVTVHSVKVRELPDLDDEFAQLASEFDTLDELRADVVGQAAQAKRYEQGIQARDRLLEKLLDMVEVPVPDGVVEAEVTSHLEGEDRLEDDEHRAEVEESTRKALRAQFLLDAVAERREVTVEQPELIEYLVMSAQQYGMDPNQFAQAVDQQGQIPAMAQEVRRRKALATLLDTAVVTDTAGASVDLEALRPAADDTAPATPGDAETDDAENAAASGVAHSEADIADDSAWGATDDSSSGATDDSGSGAAATSADRPESGTRTA